MNGFRTVAIGALLLSLAVGAGTALATTNSLPVVTAADGSNGTTLSLAVGQNLHVVLSSTYWTIAQSTSPSILRLIGQPSVTPDPNCVPGGGCGTAAATYLALAPGQADVTATRTTCGEALSCGSTPQTYTLHVVVQASTDSKPPVLNVPAGLSLDATSPAGGVATYTVTATDKLDPTPAISCKPLAGTVFPNGDSTVTCSATDSSQHTATASFSIHVKGASEQAANLISLVSGSQLGTLGTSLDKKLLTLRTMVAAHKTAQACQNLNSFLNQVKSQTGKALTHAHAFTFTSAAKRIARAVGC